MTSVRTAFRPASRRAAAVTHAPGRQGLLQFALAAIRRNAGTLLLPGAATPVLGGELVTNGDFSNGTTGWDPQATATLAVSGGLMEITCTGAGYGTASRMVSLVIGKTYWLQASSPDSGVTVRINNAAVGSPLASLALTANPTFVLYTATEATVAVAMHANSNVAGTKRNARQIGRALDPDVGGYDSWTPCGTTDAEGVLTVTHYESAGPCTSEFKAQAIAMLQDPAVLCHVVSQDYAARWADLEPPTLGECVVFCAQVTLPE